MLRFQLPMLDPGMSLNRAFGELYEERLSAGVIARPSNEFRLVTFDHMTEALAHGATTLEVVHGYVLSILGAKFSDQQAWRFAAPSPGGQQAPRENLQQFVQQDRFFAL
jgi:hypothetical protein